MTNSVCVRSRVPGSSLHFTTEGEGGQTDHTSGRVEHVNDKGDSPLKKEANTVPTEEEYGSPESRIERRNLSTKNS